MQPSPNKKKFRMPELNYIRAFLIICWRQGIKRDTRFQFWRQLFSIIWNNPGVFQTYIVNCAHLEHFIEYRQIVRNEIQAQLDKCLEVGDGQWAIGNEQWELGKLGREISQSKV
jgi:hypothetical protein